MRIGSFVENLDRQQLAKRTLVTVVTGAGGNNADAAYLWHGGSRDASHGRLAWLMRRLSRVSGRESGPPPSGSESRNPPESPPRSRLDAMLGVDPAGGFCGLREGIEQNYYIRRAINDYGGGDIAFVASPFCHFLICGARLGDDNRPSERNLRKYFASYFGHWAEHEPRFRFHQSEVLERAGLGDRLLIRFGFGIHARLDGEAPIGHLEVAPLRHDHWVEPGLVEPDGDGRNAMPGGFYPGQLGVAFAYSPLLAPVYAAGCGLPEDYLFFFGRTSLSAELQLIANAQRPAPVASAPRFQIDDRGPLPGGGVEGEQMVVREQDGPERFRLRWRGGERRDPLLTHAPPGQNRRLNLRLDSLLLPECSIRSGIGRWWVDLDARGRPAIGPLGGRSFSLTTGPGGIRLYRYLEMEYDYRVTGDTGNRGFSVRDSHYRWANLSGPRQWRMRIGLDAEAPAFAYLPLREAVHGAEGIEMRCGEPGAANQVNADWVDACAGVTVDELGPLRKGATTRLATHAFGTGGVRLRVVNGGGLELKPYQEGIAGVFDPDPDRTGGGRITAIERGDTMLLRPGQGAVVGCYLFYLDGPR